MILALRHLLGWMISAFRSREDLVLENLALHQEIELCIEQHVHGQGKVTTPTLKELDLIFVERNALFER